MEVFTPKENKFYLDKKFKLIVRFEYLQGMDDAYFIEILKANGDLLTIDEYTADMFNMDVIDYYLYPEEITSLRFEPIKLTKIAQELFTQ